jgi:hypothetical protein
MQREGRRLLLAWWDAFESGGAKGRARMPTNTDCWSLDLQPAGSGGETRLIVRGEFDMARVEAFEGAMDRLSRTNTPVVVDLRGLTLLDSCGTCSLLRTAQNVPGVKMVAPEGPARTALELSRAEERLPWVTAG